MKMKIKNYKLFKVVSSSIFFLTVIQSQASMIFSVVDSDSVSLTIVNDSFDTDFSFLTWGTRSAGSTNTSATTTSGGFTGGTPDPWVFNSIASITVNGSGQLESVSLGEEAFGTEGVGLTGGTAVLNFAEDHNITGFTQSTLALTNGTGTGDTSLSFGFVPEPSSFFLCSAGALMIGLRRKRLS